MSADETAARAALKEYMPAANLNEFPGLIGLLVRVIVAERQAILELGAGYRYECCDDFKEQILLRGK